VKAVRRTLLAALILQFRRDPAIGVAA